MKTIAIIGGGNMGEALIKGLYRTNRIIVCEANAQRAKALRKKYKVAIASIDAALRSAAVLILAVKPQDMPAALGQMQGVCGKGKLLISIAAGLTTRYFEKHFLGSKVAVVRCMPNMPALIAEGITGLCAGKYATASDIKVAQHIMRAIGDVVVLKESMLDAVTAVSGSGPAYVFLFVEQWVLAAKALGFKQDQAKALVYKTLIGSAHLLEKSAFDAAALRAKVTSKGGTTQAAMDVLLKGKFDRLMKQALLAAKKRAGALAR